MAEKIEIGGQLTNKGSAHVVASAFEVMDETLNKRQSEINQELLAGTGNYVIPEFDMFNPTSLGNNSLTLISGSADLDSNPDYKIAWSDKLGAFVVDATNGGYYQNWITTNPSRKQELFANGLAGVRLYRRQRAETSSYELYARVDGGRLDPMSQGIAKNLHMQLTAASLGGSANPLDIHYDGKTPQQLLIDMDETINAQYDPATQCVTIGMGTDLKSHLATLWNEHEAANAAAATAALQAQLNKGTVSLTINPADTVYEVAVSQSKDITPTVTANKPTVKDSNGTSKSVVATTQYKAPGASSYSTNAPAKYTLDLGSAKTVEFAAKATFSCGDLDPHTAEKKVSVKVYQPLYFGSGSAYTDIINSSCKITSTTGTVSIKGTRDVTIPASATSPKQVFIAVPSGTAAPKAKMNGFDFPFAKVKTAEAVSENGVGKGNYDIYKSSGDANGYGGEGEAVTLSLVIS